MRKQVPLVALPNPAQAKDMTAADYWKYFEERKGIATLTHLLAIERVGPSHVIDAVCAGTSRSMPQHARPRHFRLDESGALFISEPDSAASASAHHHDRDRRRRQRNRHGQDPLGRHRPQHPPRRHGRLPHSNAAPHRLRRQQLGRLCPGRRRRAFARTPIGREPIRSGARRKSST